MCGLCGIVRGDRAEPVGEAELLAMRDSLRHRGPDDAGHHLGPGVGLGSRRLSIIDLSERGRMPMSTPDGRFVIVHNGEVYNFKELRSELQAKGRTFRSQTDTEVLLYLFAERGPGMLERLNGMFAFAIWDVREKSLFLARDRLGIKPLYYSIHERDLYFASEEKALFAAGVPARFDATTWEELLCFRYVAGERTPFEGVRRLLPGHYAVWKDNRLTTIRWWNLSERAQGLRHEPPSDTLDWFRDTFDSAVNLRRISDVPVGVLLSGGLDSSSVAASLALQAGRGIASFTVRFPGTAWDEGARARELAGRYGLDYHEHVVPGGELEGRLLKASWLNDEPLTHGSDVHMLAIAEYAKPRVTVLLSGEGADETLGGYVRYRPLRHPRLLGLARRLAPLLGTVMRRNLRARKLAGFLALRPSELFVLYNACDVLPDDLRALGMEPMADFEFRRRTLDEARALYPLDEARQAMYLDQHTFLCSILSVNDRMTMGASIECRMPFLDYRLVERLAALPSGLLLRGRRGKFLLRRTLEERLPGSIRRGRKWGFTAPWAHYWREIPVLREWVLALPRMEPVSGGPIERSKIEEAIRMFFAGDDRPEPVIREMVMLTAWYRACVADRSGRGVVCAR
jgi:asparagine synthase (glutamine-hydrolysing)